MWNPAGRRTFRSKGYNKNDGMMTRKCGWQGSVGGVKYSEFTWSMGP